VKTQDDSAAATDTAVKKSGSSSSGSASTPAQQKANKLTVREGESPWTPDELAELRAELERDVVHLREEIHEAEEEIAGLLRDGGDGAGNDQADVGSTTFERDHEMSLANNARDMLAQTERALARIDNGTYGICESCGNPIGKGRLQAFPRATLCVTCKEREERR
jgi:DnaK suppressor protein